MSKALNSIALENVRHSNFNPTSAEEIIAEAKARRARFAAKAYKKPLPVDVIKDEPKPTVAKAALSKQFLKSSQKRMADRMQKLEGAEREREIDFLINKKKEQQGGFLTMEKISLEVAKKYSPLGIFLSDLYSKRRNVKSCLARHELYYRCRVETTHTLPSIGRFFGGKDHTTVLHGINKYKSYQDGAPLPKGISKEMIIQKGELK